MPRLHSLFLIFFNVPTVFYSLLKLSLLLILCNYVLNMYLEFKFAYIKTYSMADNRLYWHKNRLLACRLGTFFVNCVIYLNLPSIGELNDCWNCASTLLCLVFFFSCQCFSLVIFLVFFLGYNVQIVILIDVWLQALYST